MKIFSPQDSLQLISAMSSLYIIRHLTSHIKPINWLVGHEWAHTSHMLQKCVFKRSLWLLHKKKDCRGGPHESFSYDTDLTIHSVKPITNYKPTLVIRAEGPKFVLLTYRYKEPRVISIEYPAKSLKWEHCWLTSTTLASVFGIYCVQKHHSKQKVSQSESKGWSQLVTMRQ